MTQHRQQLPRLSIPPQLTMPQVQTMPPLQTPMTADVRPMFGQQVHPQIQQFLQNPAFLNMNSPSLQTPMQSFFQPPPGAPTRPAYAGHHQGQASMAHLTGGLPTAVPITPLATNGFPQMMLPPGSAFPPQQFQHRRRQQSVSLGGPPKAPLGGPGRKHSPLPPVATTSSAPLKKKVPMNIPQETILDEDGHVLGRPSWARTALPSLDMGSSADLKQLDLVTIDMYPPESWRLSFPGVIDVFLPGKGAWDVMKQRVIEEKLEKLGVERGSGLGSTVPHIYAPHARAASISSPADPALLYFKLNKLQQAQAASSSGASLSTSPQPPLNLTPSPNLSLSSSQSLGPPRFQSNSAGSTIALRHGHSMSLAQPPSHHTTPPYNPSAAFNPFGPDATLGSDQILQNSSPRVPEIYAPQGRVPVAVASLTVPTVSRPNSKPDFVRGFGLDIPEEEEPPEGDGAEGDHDRDMLEANEDDRVEDEAIADERSDGAEGHSTEMGEDKMTEGVIETHQETVPETLRGPPPSHKISRHVSHLSAALSLASVGGTSGGNVEDNAVQGLAMESVVHDIEDMDRDAVEEWTGSEDLQAAGDTTSDDESIGEWSNPSDEERARHQRLQRRMRRRALSQPRRIPNFPRPPDNTYAAPLHAHHHDDTEEIISNPSEEGHMVAHEAAAGHDHYLGVQHAHRLPSPLAASRPLPQLPAVHSRNGSLSSHDPALAHSVYSPAVPSTQMMYSMPLPPPVPPHLPQQASRHHTPASSIGRPRGDSVTLNPFAKPFVFGGNRQSSGSWAPGTFGQSSTPPISAGVGSNHHPNGSAAGSATHSRMPSLGKPLNVAAPEFKPGQFTFRPPPGVPHMPAVTPTEVARPLPVPPEGGVPRAQQGREKRQRRGSSASEVEEVEEEGNSMVSFKFPAVAASPERIGRSTVPSTPPQTEAKKQGSLNAAAQPFTFSGFSSALSLTSNKENMAMPHSVMANAGSPEEIEDDAADAENVLPNDLQAESPTDEFSIPISQPKVKRAPIPLDFKHPVSKNTVPAGLFKALVNGSDERTRRSVRSRLGSREIFDHSQRPSLDDLTVPSIAHSSTRGRYITDPGLREPARDANDLFSPSQQRRSSLPDGLQSAPDSPLSGVSIPALNLTRQLEIQGFQHRLEKLLDDKLESIRRELLRTKDAVNNGHSLNGSTEAMIAEVVSLFRTQLNESAARGLEESQMDARGELDFELIKDVIQQGHEESRNLLHRLLDDVVQRLDLRNRSAGTNMDEVASMVKQLSNTTVNAVLGAMSQISLRLEVIENTPNLDRDALLRELTAVLAPILHTLQPEPVDYDALTDRLTQAVKPHISQLIDLASDKRETAGLIVDRLIPLLPSLVNQPAIDTDLLIGQITSEVRRIIAPIDAFEIKEQVADLVVERLDSRLAVRDQAFNVDTVTEKVSESVASRLEAIQLVAFNVNSLIEGQHALAEKSEKIASTHSSIYTLLSDLPQQLSQATEAVNTARTELLTLSKVSSEPSEAIQDISTAVSSLAEDQRVLSRQSFELLTLHRDIISHLDALPESLSSATSLLQTAHADLFSSQDSYKQDQDELRQLRNVNTDLQVQLAKARGAHGQVRVEKDVFSDKFKGAEAERDRLRDRLQEAQNGLNEKIQGMAILESRNTELEGALAQALERLKISDVAAQTTQERISELEKANREATTANQMLKSKIDSLELKAEFATHEKDSAVDALAILQRQYDDLASQQSHWEELRHASEKIDQLTELIGKADNEELRDLRRIRDRSRTLETEHTALQKRAKDFENKALNSERAATAARQSLAQAQQRASEWERRAKEYDGELELVQTKLEHSEQAHQQLDTDYSLVKLQLEEREAEDRLTKDRECKLRDQVSSLEARLARLQSELEQAKKPQIVPPTPSASRKSSYVPPRPDSRASTVFGNGRTVMPLGQMNGLARASSRTSSERTESPSRPSVRPSVKDSMHAPKRYGDITPVTPKARRPNSYYRPTIPSPTPSTVSLAPTLDDEGWYS